MRYVFFLFFDLLTTLAKLIRPGGARSVVAGNLLLKQQLIIHSRPRQRAPNLTTLDRAVPGFLSLFLRPRRLVRSAVIIRPSTLLSFHNALNKRKYRRLFSHRGGRKPGPKGPTKEVIPDKAGQALRAIVEMKQRNPRYGCPRIAHQVNLAFGLDIDPLFQYHRWKANLRVLDIEEIKSVPHVPMSHPFVERLIGSLRREFLDHTFFWTATDLETKLRHYQDYYNEHRCHSSRDCKTPVESGGNKIVDISGYRWQNHCRGLFQLPVPA